MRSLWLCSLILVSLSLGAAPAPAPEAAMAVDPPRLDVSPSGLVNLGSLGPREKRVQKYSFRNRSDAPLSLRVEDAPKGMRVEGQALLHPVMPGEAQDLELEVDATGHSGWLRRRVRLRTDDPRQGAYVLPVEATVRPDLEVDAVRKHFSPARSYESPELVFQFRRETGEPLALRLLSELPPYLEARIAGGKEAEQGRGELHVVLRASQVEAGVLQGLETFRVGTSVADQPVFTLYADWRIQPLLEVSPSRLVFDGQERSELKICRSDGKAFTLAEATLDGEGFRLERGLDQGLSIEQRVSVRRTGQGPVKAALVLGIRGDPERMRVPLVGLPVPHSAVSAGSSMRPSAPPDGTASAVPPSSPAGK